jgi:hypothetical protein
MALNDSYVVRAKDNSGDSVAAFLDTNGRAILELKDKPKRRVVKKPRKRKMRQ